jgi:LysM repeat protein
MKNLFVFILFLMPLFAIAQKTHKVAAKESLFSIGRLYNVHPRELAAYNKIDFEKGLTLGQLLKIPSKKSQPAVKESTTPATAAVKKEIPAAEPVKNNVAKATNPLYHTVAKKEGLYSISKIYHQSIADIKKWNNLSTDALTEGMNLVVGFKEGTAAATAEVSTLANNERPEVEKEKPAKTVVKSTVKETVKPETSKAGHKNGVDFKGGYFKSIYDQQIAGKTASEETGLAGIFKSTSGWEDGKYYCLHNSVPAGSYIKITNSSNQKSIYAKVLDLIPDLKQNNKLIIRISNAAAAELGAGSTDFNCSLQF